MTHTQDIQRPSKELIEGLLKIGSATASGELHLSVNTPIACGDTLVMPGDIVIADDDGIVCVPIKLAPLLLEHASEKAEWEEFSRIRLSQGGDLRKYYPLTDEAQAEFEAWKNNQNSA